MKKDINNSEIIIYESDRKFQVKELSPIEREYLKSINDINNLTQDINLK